MTIPTYAETALNILEAAGHTAYVVGGCVRDSFMGRTPGDWDICTSALPEVTHSLFQDRFHVIDTGLKHGTVTVVIEGHPLEITTFRREFGYSDHRRPDRVEFVPEVEEDLSRRDFTMNAMAFSPKRGLKDPFGGQKDIEARVIRCVGAPYQRFEEDALRILRAVRFMSVLAFDVEEKTAKAATELAPALENVAAERRYTELRKLLTGPWAAKSANKFPQVLEMAAGGHLLPEPRGAQDTATAFALSFRDPAGVLSALKAPKAVITSAKVMTQAALPENIPQALRLLGQVGTEDFARIRDYFAILGKNTAIFDQALESGLPWKVSQLDITGQDLLGLGFEKGPELGRTLNRLLEAVMDGRCGNEKAALMKWALEVR